MPSRVWAREGRCAFCLVQLLLVINRNVGNLLSLCIRCGGSNGPRLTIARHDDATSESHLAAFLTRERDSVLIDRSIGSGVGVGVPAYRIIFPVEFSSPLAANGGTALVNALDLSLIHI